MGWLPPHYKSGKYVSRPTRRRGSHFVTEVDMVSSYKIITIVILHVTE